MRAIGLMLMLVAMQAQSAWAKSGDGAPLKPTSQWAIEYADQSCRLIRNFDNGQDQITLAFERFMPGPELRLGLAGTVPKFSVKAKSAKFSFGPNGHEQEAAMLISELADGRKSHLIRVAALTENLAPPKTSSGDKPPPYVYSETEELAAARKIDTVTLAGSFGSSAVVDLGPMEMAIQALQGCVTELMHEWGLDNWAKGPPRRLAMPIGNPGKWMDSSDYPRDMLAKRRQGIVGFRLVVNERGLVDKCFVDVDKQGPFKEAVCQAITKRAHFEPALDSDGKPMRSLYSNSVRFQF